MKSNFTNQDISDYYDQTEVHYRYFWDLDKSRALHYGFWHQNTKTFRESLENTNLEMAQLAEINSADYVLDAGCGVGGSSVFLAKTFGCKVKGISLSEKQINKAKTAAARSGLGHLLSFDQKDYCQTGYESSSFDCIWALESAGSAADKRLFLNEAHRLLRPGGRLIVADYFKTFPEKADSIKVMKDWLNAWAISDLEQVSDFEMMLTKSGFSLAGTFDRTKAITPSSKRMYNASWFGMLGTKAYNLFKNASPFSKIHYRSGIAQYKALRKGLWNYHVLLAHKPVERFFDSSKNKNPDKSL